MGLLQKIFGTHSENELKRIYPIVDEIEALGPQTMVLIICKVSILISFIFGAGRIGSNSQSDDKQTDK